MSHWGGGRLIRHSHALISLSTLCLREQGIHVLHQYLGMQGTFLWILIPSSTRAIAVTPNPAPSPPPRDRQFYFKHFVYCLLRFRPRAQFPVFHFSSGSFLSPQSRTSVFRNIIYNSFNSFNSFNSSSLKYTMAELETTPR
jgi:hypothetical protein